MLDQYIIYYEFKIFQMGSAQQKGGFIYEEKTD